MSKNLWTWRVIFFALSIGFVFAAFGEFAKYAVDSHNEPSDEVVAYAQTLSVFLTAAGLCLLLLAISPFRFRMLAVPGILCALGMVIRYYPSGITVGFPEVSGGPLWAMFYLLGAGLLSLFLYAVRPKA